MLMERTVRAIHQAAEADFSLRLSAGPLTGSFGMQNQSKLNDAYERFRCLSRNRESPESEWQQLFTDCPFIFSESLAIRIHKDDI